MLSQEFKAALKAECQKAMVNYPPAYDTEWQALGDLIGSILFTVTESILVKYPKDRREFIEQAQDQINQWQHAVKHDLCSKRKDGRHQWLKNVNPDSSSDKVCKYCQQEK